MISLILCQKTSVRNWSNYTRNQFENHQVKSDGLPPNKAFCFPNYADGRMRSKVASNILQNISHIAYVK